MKMKEYEREVATIYGHTVYMCFLGIAKSVPRS